MRTDVHRIARRLRRSGPGRPDARSEAVGPGITRSRDPRFADRRLRPSPALLARPEPTGEPAGQSPRFVDRDGWFGVRVELAPGTDVYGTGEVAGPLRRNGRTIELWTTDAFGYNDRTPRLYQAHPWALCVRPDGTAFGVLADSPRRGLVSAGRDLLMAFEGEPFEVYIVERPHPAGVVAALSDLTGRPPLPPRWALGYHQCRWSYEPESRVREIARGFREREIPCDVLWMDIDYMNGFRVFSFDGDRFPSPTELNDDLHAQGFKTVWMIDPGVKVDPNDDVYRSGRDGGHFIRGSDGAEFRGEVWPGACAFPDFMSDRTRQWWAKLYGPYMAHGIDGVWNDMNEPAVFDGPGKSMPASNLHEADDDLGGPGSHARYHNIYGMQMVRATREGVGRARPDRRPFVLTRSNFLGGHRYAATWTGDNTSDWTHLHRSITMALNLGLSGQPFVGPDIGGFAGDADGHLFARWMGLGALLPFARGHSIKGSVDHEPWSFGERCERLCRLALERRYRLLPYLYTLFHEASRTGLPVVRPLFFADPTDRALRDADDAFLLGEDVLVRARVRPGGICRSPLPRGAWAGFEPARASDPELPELFVRPGAAVPLGPAMQHSGERPLDPLTLVTNLDENGRASAELYEDDGDGFGFESGECRLAHITIERRDGEIASRTQVRSGKWPPTDRRIEIVPVGPNA